MDLIAPYHLWALFRGLFIRMIVASTFFLSRSLVFALEFPFFCSNVSSPPSRRAPAESGISTIEPTRTTAVDRKLNNVPTNLLEVVGEMDHRWTCPFN